MVQHDIVILKDVRYARASRRLLGSLELVVVWPSQIDITALEHLLLPHLCPTM